MANDTKTAEKKHAMLLMWSSNLTSHPQFDDPGKANGSQFRGAGAAHASLLQPSSIGDCTVIYIQHPFAEGW